MELNEIALPNLPNVKMSQEQLYMRNMQILEKGPQMSQDLNVKNLPVPEVGSQALQDLNITNLRIVEEGPRVCPVCSNEIKMYFINYYEKIEMCESLDCDYPFGYEPLKILREENGVQTVEINSMTAKSTRSVSGSQVSSHCWSDVDKVCNVFETEETPSMDFNKLKTVPTIKKTDSDRRREELFKNVEKIKQMTKHMNDTKKESMGIIKNEKWIKNLQYLQDLSGLNLLKPAEMKKIKKHAGAPGSSELKIDIDKNNLASIKIELNRTSAPNTKLD